MLVSAVKPNVYFCDLPGTASNVFFIKTMDGVVLVDTSIGAAEIQAVLFQSNVDPNDVTWLINTHADGDHVGGNGVFECPRYAHQLTYQRMTEAGRGGE